MPMGPAASVLTSDNLPWSYQRSYQVLFPLFLLEGKPGKVLGIPPGPLVLQIRNLKTCHVVQIAKVTQPVTVLSELATQVYTFSKVRGLYSTFPFSVLVCPLALSPLALANTQLGIGGNEGKIRSQWRLRSICALEESSTELGSPTMLLSSIFFKSPVCPPSEISLR